MNIFYLHTDPVICAMQHCDTHSSKMCVEYAQLLSTAHRVIDGEMVIGRSKSGSRIKRYVFQDTTKDSLIYKASHANHPSNIWVRQSVENYNWLYQLWIALGAEYTYRYGREHESLRKLSEVLETPPQNLKENGFTQPTPAMKAYPHCIIPNDSVSSYRNFYREDKKEFAKWSKREIPEWWSVAA